MGEPAVPTPAEQAETLKLARSIVEAVHNDETGPAWIDAILMHLRTSMSPDDSQRLDIALYWLAQDLANAADERDRLRAQVRSLAAWSKANYRCPYFEPCGECLSCRVSAAEKELGDGA